MFFKGFFPAFGDGILCVWFPPDKRFGNTDVFHFLKAFEMGRQITVSDLQKVFQRVKIVAFVGRQDTHDPEPDIVFKSLIEMM